MKLLFVGDLSYNSERISLFKDYGCDLKALFTPSEGWNFNNNYVDFELPEISQLNWEVELPEFAPDVMYCLGNQQSIDWIYQIVTRFPEIPYILHLKEWEIDGSTPIENLKYLFSHSAGTIFISQEHRLYLKSKGIESENMIVMDLDKQKAEFFTDDFSEKLSTNDHKIHTVNIGRTIGITAELLNELAKYGVTFHHYASEENNVLKHCPNYCHHNPVKPENWVSELSKYDASWMHILNCKNYGDYSKCEFLDYNIAAKITTSMAAGLPVIQKNNKGHICTQFSLLNGIGVSFNFVTAEGIVKLLKDSEKLHNAQQAALDHRMEFTFDYDFPRLMSFIETSINYEQSV